MAPRLQRVAREYSVIVAPRPMPLTLYFRPENGQVVPEPLATWESPAFVAFPSVRALQAAADAQGLRALFYDGPEALFPHCEAGTAWCWADAEEEV